MSTKKIIMTTACVLANSVSCQEPQLSAYNNNLDTDTAASYVRYGPHVSLGITPFYYDKWVHLPCLRVGYVKRILFNQEAQPRAIIDAGVAVPTLAVVPYISVRMIAERWTIGPEVGLVTLLGICPMGAVALLRVTCALGGPNTNGSGWFMSAGVSYNLGSVSLGYTF